jgi:hypothetical protein
MAVNLTVRCGRTPAGHHVGASAVGLYTPLTSRRAAWLFGVRNGICDIGCNKPAVESLLKVCCEEL